MAKNSNYWFTAIYVVVVACYIGIFYPETNPAIALFSGAIAAFIMLAISYILNK